MVAIALLVLCLQDHTGKAMFLLFYCFEEMLHDLNCAYVKVSSKALLFSVADLGTTVWHPLNAKFAPL